MKLQITIFSILVSTSVLATAPLQCEILTGGVQKCKDETKVCYVYKLDSTKEVGISCIDIADQPIEKSKKRP